MIFCEYEHEDGTTLRLDYRELKDLSNKLVLISDKESYEKYPEKFTKVGGINLIILLSYSPYTIQYRTPFLSNCTIIPRCGLAGIRWTDKHL